MDVFHADCRLPHTALRPNGHAAQNENTLTDYQEAISVTMRMGQPFGNREGGTIRCRSFDQHIYPFTHSWCLVLNSHCVLSNLHTKYHNIDAQTPDIRTSHSSSLSMDNILETQTSHSHRVNVFNNVHKLIKIAVRKKKEASGSTPETAQKCFFTKKWYKK